MCVYFECSLTTAVLRDADIFHHYTAWLGAWTALKIRGWPTDAAADEFDVLLVDEHPRKTRQCDSLSDAIWGLFGQVQRATEFPSGRVCFENVVFATQGWASFQLYQTAAEHARGGFPACTPSTMFVDFSSWLMTAIDPSVAEIQKQHEMTRAQHAAESGLRSGYITIALVGRRKETSVHGSRMILNEPQLLHAMQRGHGIDVSTSRWRLDLKIKVSLLYFEDFGLLELVRTMATVDVLIGMHGAGLTNLLFLPKSSAVVELFNMGMGTERGDFEYQKMAQLLGIQYSNWTNADEARQKLSNSTKREAKRRPAIFASTDVDIDEVCRTVWKSLDKIFN